VPSMMLSLEDMVDKHDRPGRHPCSTWLTSQGKKQTIKK
jgi:hypothetical protein